VLHLSSCLSIISQIQSTHSQCQFNTESFFYKTSVSIAWQQVNLALYCDNITEMRTTNKIYFSWVLNV
jgi:uncharacterized protein with WD repeat